MPSRQQKFAKKGSKKVLNVWTKSHFSNFEMGWRTFSCSRKCLLVVLRYKLLLGLSKLRNRMFLGKCTKWNLIFLNWSKGLCLGVSEPTKRTTKKTKWLLRVQHRLCKTHKTKRHLSKKMKKIKRQNEKKKIEICKILEIYDDFFSN